MNDYFFAVGCCSMCLSLAAATYGAHGGLDYDQKLRWDTSVQIQQIGSLPLLLSYSKKSSLSGVLAITGVSMFCIPLYYRTVKDDTTYNKLMPYGGMAMMASWIALGFLS